LAGACPLGQDNPIGCPLHAVRQLPLDERVVWIESLSVEHLLKITTHHRACRPLKEFMQSMK
jgi:hypothetical protein